MNLRRLMSRPPSRRTTPYHIERKLLCVTANRGSRLPVRVKTGPPVREAHVRFRQQRTCQSHWLGPLCAKNGLMRRGKTMCAIARLLDHLVSTGEKVGWHVKPKWIQHTSWPQTKEWKPPGRARLLLLADDVN